jgi:hypothetical protein
MMLPSWESQVKRKAAQITPCKALLGGDEGLKIDNTTAIFFFKTFEGYPQSIPGRLRSLRPHTIVALGLNH